MHKVKLWHYIPNCIITFFLVIVIFLLEAVLFTTQNILKTKTYTDILSQNNVIGLIYDDLNNYFDKLYSSTGVPGEVYMEGVSRVLISNAAFSYFDENISYLNGSSDKRPEIKYDFSALETSVKDYFDSYAEENGIDPNEEEYENLCQATIDKAKGYIESDMDLLFFRYLNKNDALLKIHNNIKYLYMLQAVLIIAAAALAGGIVFVNRHHIHNSLYWICAAGLSCSALEAVPAIILKNSGYFNNLIIKTEYLRTTIISICSKMLNDYIQMAAMTALFSAILMIVYLSVLLSGRSKHH